MKLFKNIFCLSFCCLSHFFIMLLLIGTVANAGCSPQKVFHDDKQRPLQGVIFGRVVHSATVKVTQMPNYLIPATGAIAGGVAGAFIGGPKTTVAGIALGGSLASSELSPGTTYRITELTVELDDGRYVLIHVGDEEYFTTGDKVRILLIEKNSVRVQHI